MKEIKDVNSNLPVYSRASQEPKIGAEDTISQDIIVGNQFISKPVKQNQLADYLISKADFKEYEEMYKVVDFLNKNLKSEGMIFGLTKNNCSNTISIYKLGKI